MSARRAAWRGFVAAIRVRDCLDGARSVRAAECARDVVGSLRPRSAGFFRTRAPISLQLYRAAGDGRLVWRGPDSFAMLQRPADRRAKGSGWALRWVDRQWTLVVLLAEFALLVGSVLVLVALRRATGHAALRRATGHAALLYGAYLAEVVFFAVVAADQLTGLLQMVWRGLRSLVRDAPRTDQVAAESLPYEQWVMALCHHVPENGAGALLGDVGRRLVWRDAPGLTAETFYSRGMGVLVGVFVPLTVLMAAASMLNYRRYRAALRTD